MNQNGSEILALEPYGRLEVLRIAAASGGRQKSPIVFLHEGLGSVAMWTRRGQDWPAKVCAATGRPGVVYSRRGYGRSDPVPHVRGHGRLRPDYMHHEAWAVLPALLAQLGIDRPILFGHSDGGSIALLYANRYNPLACVLLAPHVIVEDCSIAAIEQARQHYEQGPLRERLARYHQDVDCAFWQWNDAWLNPEFRHFDLRALCRNIRAPLLAIQGEQDPYGTMAQIEQIAPTQAAVQLEKLSFCGHSPHWDQPDMVLQRVVEFLQKQD